MKRITSVTILAILVAIVGGQGHRSASTAEPAAGSVTSPSITDTGLATATGSPTIKTQTDSPTDSSSFETSANSEIDVDGTPTLDDIGTNTWTGDGFTPAPSMIASRPFSMPPKLTPVAGPATAYASTSMPPAATAPPARPSNVKSNSAGPRVGIIKAEWLALGLIAAVAATLL